MKILVLGCKGQLGRCLNDQLVNTENEVIYTSREQIDIADFEVTKNQILKTSPDLIINATAYTAVDKAEEDQKTANLINHLAVKNIADICNQLECWLIHVSTDYVFDGNSKVPYKEDDETNPQGAYGETKLNGELAIQSSGCKHIIIRTAWVFSEYGNNFLKTVLRLGSERDELSIVGDQIGCPTYAQDIARSIVEIAPQLNSRKDNDIYHYCGDQPCSWYDFANAIFDQAMTNNLKIPSIVNSIETTAYPTPAKRPAFSVLNCSKIENDFGVHASNWYGGIGQVISKLKLENPVP
ncbi:dTDP-4-dehydrorhamnose reductase [Porticoccaceae bacterium]|nr:dTDP-4-dehydrorhamnose reductase [Porticoccaceae bacterium]